MDWWKLFALLFALASFFTTLEGAKKKIRIHLPQKVKHIHHHKKIYITNHPASSQYAPAYLPTAEGAASSVAFQSGLVPLKSVGSELYEDRPMPQLAPDVAPAASKLLPLYKARGYYGPQPQASDWEEQEYDLVPPPEPTGPDFLPSAFSAPSAPAASSSYPSKKIKVIKVKETPRKKKIVRKRKPKRVVHAVPPVEEEHPVSTFHEQFYSDIDTSGTIKKIRKPKRVEKIIDGDTEHIHTYSEEHIHKVVFDDASKLTGVVGGSDPLASMSGMAAAHPLVPLKNHQALLALEGGSFGGLASVGTLGTPSHIEYASYNPREVTHDHVFHEHGELPPNIDLSKDILSFPPKVSYTSQGLRITGDAKRIPGKSNYHKAVKPTRPTPPIDFSYYESMYTANGRPKKPLRPTKIYGEQLSEPSIDDYRPIPSFNYKQKPKPIFPTYASPYYGHTSVKPSSAYQVGQASISVPFSTSSTVVHNVNPSPYTGAKSQGIAGYSNFKDPFTAYKGTYTNNFEYDTHASSSNYFNKGTDDGSWRNQKGKKSISTQNVSFGGQDHKTVVDHLADASHVEPVVQENSQNQVQQLDSFDHSSTGQEHEHSTPTAHFTITENTASHDYFSNMALKAFEDDQLSVAEASNDNYHYVEAPTTPAAPQASVATTADSRPYYRVRNSETTTLGPINYEPDNRKITKRRKQRNKASMLSVSLEPRQKYPAIAATEEHPTEVEASSNARPFSTYKRPRARPTQLEDHSYDSTQVKGKFKYGDKI